MADSDFYIVWPKYSLKISANSSVATVKQPENPRLLRNCCEVLLKIALNISTGYKDGDNEPKNVSLQDIFLGCPLP